MKIEKKIVVSGMPGVFDTPEQARIAALEVALRQIKTICAGDRLPYWKEDMNTVTVTRGKIMDICELADKR